VRTFYHKNDRSCYFERMDETSTPADRTNGGRKQRSDGERSRKAILTEAAQLATVEGIEGLSIARLASAVGMSKSGLFAHFGSKQELQLATIETASELFTEIVVAPALEAPTGLERLLALSERFLDHVEANVYPGGCFFASIAAEMDTHPGPVRDRAIELTDQWFGLVVAAAADAQSEGAIAGSEDVAQLGFEINSFLLLANAQFIVSQEPSPLDRARHAIRRRLAEAA
jgi:AcrR family transcriptional regulator